MSRKTIKFSFSNSRGQMLAGIIDLPENPRFYGVFAPCFTCTKESHAAHKICRALAEHDVAMLRFDMTGLGESKGDFAETNFSTRIADLVSACNAFGAAYQPVKLLVGHSISGTAAISAAKSLADLQMLATLGSPRDPEYVIEKFRRNNHIILKGDMAELNVLGRKFIVRKTFINDMLSQTLAQDTAAYDRKLMIFHAPRDEIVNFENAEIIHERATCDKELLPLSGNATHLLEQGAEDALYIAETISSWFDRHLT